MIGVTPILFVPTQIIYKFVQPLAGYRVDEKHFFATRYLEPLFGKIFIRPVRIYLSHYAYNLSRSRRGGRRRIQRKRFVRGKHETDHVNLVRIQCESKTELLVLYIFPRRVDYILTVIDVLGLMVGYIVTVQRLSQRGFACAAPTHKHNFLFHFRVKSS